MGRYPARQVRRPVNPERTLYDVLEVSHLASPVVVKAAYRSLAQSLHPDKNLGTQAAGERLAEINNAYAVVSDAAKRLKYDRTLALNTAITERRGVVPAGEQGRGPFSAGSNLSRPFAFRSFD